MSSFSAFIAETSEQKEQLYRFRYEVFVEEQHKYVLVADHEQKRFADALDEVAVHVCVAYDGRIVASVRNVRGADRFSEAMRSAYQVDRFQPSYSADQMSCSGRLLVLPEFRGSRALLHLLHLTYESVRALGVLVDFINCNPHLVRLYEQLGYRRFRDSYEDPHLGYQVPMVLLTDDRSHLEGARSPFAALSPRFPTRDDRTSWFVETFPEYAAVISPTALGNEEFISYLSRRVNSNDVPLLKDLAEPEVTDLLAFATHLRVARGTRLVRRGDMGQELFVILEGVAEVRRSQGTGSALLATLGRGDAFGEMSVVTSKVRSADVVAVSDLEVLCLDQSTLRKLSAANPAVASKLLLNLCQILADRLETTSALVA